MLAATACWTFKIVHASSIAKPTLRDRAEKAHVVALGRFLDITSCQGLPVPLLIASL